VGGIVVGSQQLESHQAGRAFGGGGRERWHLRETGSWTRGGAYFPERGGGLSVCRVSSSSSSSSSPTDVALAGSRRRGRDGRRRWGGERG
jgi:hypothetical protein